MLSWLDVERSLLKDLLSTAALGFGSGFGVGFVSSSLGQLYDKNPLPIPAERVHIHQRLEVVAFAAALIASSTFSIGILLHGSLTATPAPIEPEGA